MELNNTKNREESIVKEFYVLGTIIGFKIYGYNTANISDKAVEKLYEIDDKMSVFKNDSEISKINENSGIKPTSVSSDTFTVIKKAQYYSELSKGAFDPTIRPIMNFWNIGTINQGVPDAKKILGELSKVDYHSITLDEVHQTVMLSDIGQLLDLGGIAKGFAADMLRDIFKNNGIESAIIDLGGNIYALGGKTDGAPWSIGIQNPFGVCGSYIGELSLKDKSVVTSGNYERYFYKNDKRYHHIIDPRTGYPCDNGIVSTTIISDNSMDGDALSTCIFTMGIEKGIDFIENLPNIDAIWITENKEIYITKGIKNIFNLLTSEFEVIDRRYH